MVLCGKQFLAQKSIIEVEYASCSPDLAPNDLWLFPKKKKASPEGTKISGYWQKKCDDGTESCSAECIAAQGKYCKGHPRQ